GFCGSFTTFSSIMLEIFEMLRLGQFAQAGLYLLVTIVMGLLALIGGYSLGTKWA
ncbi:MAG: CrcB family protein, partial [Bacteroidetes bacterium]